MGTSKTLTTIAFDADDTLWHNETVFRLTEERFAEALSGYSDPKSLTDRLLEAELRNLRYYGYGIKGFTLSMIETALEVSEGKVPTSIIAEILSYAKQMISHPVEPLPLVRETLEGLRKHYVLLIITKGDLFDQERKIAQSGLADLFHAIEIVSEKTTSTYSMLFERHGDGPERAMMVGNSLKSDVLPALEAGSWGVFIPHEVTWSFEHADEPIGAARYRHLEKLSDLPMLLSSLLP